MIETKILIVLFFGLTGTKYIYIHRLYIDIFCTRSAKRAVGSRAVTRADDRGVGVTGNEKTDFILLCRFTVIYSGVCTSARMLYNDLYNENENESQTQSQSEKKKKIKIKNQYRKLKLKIKIENQNQKLKSKFKSKLKLKLKKSISKI